MPVRVVPADTDRALEVTITVWGASSRVAACVADRHTRLILLEKDGQTLFCEDAAPEAAPEAHDPLTMDGIYDFAATARLEDVKDLIDRQIDLNTRIAQEGLSGEWGAGVGKVLLDSCADLPTRAKAMAAAGSDARMGGCALPVVINAGSGNQGLTVSLPVITYARAMGASDEALCRALLLSNLVSIHQRTGMGRLGAFCGAVCAGAAAGAGITYLKNGDYEAVCRTVTNALAITSGIVCDGAKPSCAAKIAASVDAGFWAGAWWRMGAALRRARASCRRISKTRCQTSPGWERTACGRRTARFCASWWSRPRAAGSAGRDGMKRFLPRLAALMLALVLALGAFCPALAGDDTDWEDILWWYGLLAEENRPVLGALIDEDGAYDGVVEVGIYRFLYGGLPGNYITKAEARSLGWPGGALEPYAPGKCIGGDRFGNYEGLLPEDGRYVECDIDTMEAPSRGAKRLVIEEGGAIYYTEDHYETFTLLYAGGD